ncbi:SH3 domain-containing protein [Leptospira wolffii]|uniref:SH3 domain-containing protein n=1 Tax=Leptospira wolffii TaxID=409998 RepID=UPI001AEFD5B6|nr:SH3 domain-containing protein [Leptospira wolffii]
MIKNTTIIFIFSLWHLGNLQGNPTKSQEIELTDERIVSTVGSGLRLRSGPSLNSETIEMISNRTTITFIKEESNKTKVNGKLGKWTNVEYEGKVGWVFSAFLIKVYKFSLDNSNIQDGCNIEDVLSSKFGLLGKRKNIKPNVEASETRKYRQHYNLGIYLESTTYLGGGYATIIFPNQPMNDIHRLFQKCDPDLAKVVYEPDNNIFKVEFKTDSGVSKSYSIEFQNNSTIVNFGGQI